MHADALSNLSIVYARTGMSDRAIEHFEAVLRFDLSNLPDHNLANAYEMKGMTERADAPRRKDRKPVWTVRNACQGL